MNKITRTTTTETCAI